MGGSYGESFSSSAASSSPRAAADARRFRPRPRPLACLLVAALPAASVLHRPRALATLTCATCPTHALSLQVIDAASYLAQGSLDVFTLPWWQLICSQTVRMRAAASDRTFSGGKQRCSSGEGRACRNAAMPCRFWHSA